MPSVRALACPASLKGVMSAREAAAALAEGLRSWAEVDELPVADGGEGTLDAMHAALGGEWHDELPAPTRVACDVDVPLVDAARLFAQQKGASSEDVLELERRLLARPRLAPYADLPGAGSAGGLGAALASLGAELIPGAPLVLDLVGFDVAGYDLVVTGEGTVDLTTIHGKAPGEVARRCVVAGV